MKGNYKKLIEDYVYKQDWRVKENSTTNYSISGLHNFLSSANESKYWLEDIYTEDIGRAHMDCDFHLHDLGTLASYCSGWSLKELITRGLNGVPGKISSAPAKHLTTLVNQMVNFIGIMSNEWAGAQAFSSFDTYLAPFVRTDNLSFKEVKQAIQNFVFGLNIPSRWGGQAPFSNITLDWVCPDDIKEEYAIVGGKEQEYKYKDLAKEMEMINKAFLEIMIDGDSDGRGFLYPIPTYNLTKDFVWEGENADLLFEMTSKYGTPYFQNFINSDLNPSDVRSMCVHGDTKVRVIFPKEKIKTSIKISELLENYDAEDFMILTSQGYRPIERKIITESDTLLKITTELGLELKVTKDHPSLVYDAKGELVVIKSSELQVGMQVSLSKNLSMKGENNPNFGHKWTNEMKENMSENKKEYFSNDNNKLFGEKNPMFGKTHTEETKEKISKYSKAHNVTDNCRKLSSERWKGTSNPVAKDTYWENKENKMQISQLEYLIKDYMEANDIEGIHQKVFVNENKVYVADFYIPSKNLIIESESKYDDISYNEYCGYVDKEKFDFYTNNGFNILVVNPEKTNAWIGYLNKKDTIVSIEEIPHNDKVYDVEIKENSGNYDVHDFYANDILTHNCCRLQLSKRELMKKTGGLFGAGEKTGSVGVVTINLPKIAYLSKNKEEFYDRLKYLMNLAKNSLETKRKILLQYLELGMYPYTKAYLEEGYKTYFSTIGLVGMNEMCLNANWIKKDLMNEDAIAFSEEVLEFMKNKIADYQEETSHLYNLEATPKIGH